MTTAKEYLVRLRNADLKIQATRLEIEQLKILATCSGGLNNDQVSVKTSKAAVSDKQRKPHSQIKGDGERT